MKFPVLWLSFVNVLVGLGLVINRTRGPVSYCKLPASGRIRKYKYNALTKENVFTYITDENGVKVH